MENIEPVVIMSLLFSGLLLLIGHLAKKLIKQQKANELAKETVKADYVTMDVFTAAMAQMEEKNRKQTEKMFEVVFKLGVEEGRNSR